MDANPIIEMGENEIQFFRKANNYQRTLDDIEGTSTDAQKLAIVQDALEKLQQIKNAYEKNIEDEANFYARVLPGVPHNSTLPMQRLTGMKKRINHFQQLRDYYRGNLMAIARTMTPPRQRSGATVVEPPTLQVAGEAIENKWTMDESLKRITRERRPYQNYMWL